MHVSASSQKRWLSTFEKTGDVFPPERGVQGRPRALSKDEEFDLVTRVLDSPTTTLGKQHALIYLGREGELAHAMPRAACAQLVPPAHTAPRS